MYESTCEMCGAPMFAVREHDKKKFCSKKCFGAYLHLKQSEKDAMQRTPNLGELKDLSDDSFVALVGAIVERASHDVVHLSPTSHHRITAERFFLSDYFAVLTNLEGKPILAALQAEYMERMRKKNKGGKNG